MAQSIPMLLSPELTPQERLYRAMADPAGMAARAWAQEDASRRPHDGRGRALLRLEPSAFFALFPNLADTHPAEHARIAQHDAAVREPTRIDDTILSAASSWAEQPAIFTMPFADVNALLARCCAEWHQRQYALHSTGHCLRVSVQPGSAITVAAALIDSPVVCILEIQLHFIVGYAVVQSGPLEPTGGEQLVGMTASNQAVCDSGGPAMPSPAQAAPCRTLEPPTEQADGGLHSGPAPSIVLPVAKLPMDAEQDAMSVASLRRKFAQPPSAHSGERTQVVAAALPEKLPAPNTTGPPASTAAQSLADGGAPRGGNAAHQGPADAAERGSGLRPVGRPLSGTPTVSPASVPRNSSSVLSIRSRFEPPASLGGVVGADKSKATPSSVQLKTTGSVFKLKSNVSASRPVARPPVSAKPRTVPGGHATPSPRGRSTESVAPVAQPLLASFSTVPDIATSPALHPPSPLPSPAVLPPPVLSGTCNVVLESLGAAEAPVLANVGQRLASTPYSDGASVPSPFVLSAPPVEETLTSEPGLVRELRPDMLGHMPSTGPEMPAAGSSDSWSHLSTPAQSDTTSNQGLGLATQKAEAFCSPPKKNVFVPKVSPAELCARCSKRVYTTDRLGGVDAVLHKACFRCFYPDCGSSLTLKSYESISGKPHCKPHAEMLNAQSTVTATDYAGRQGTKTCVVCYESKPAVSDFDCYGQCQHCDSVCLADRIHHAEEQLAVVGGAVHCIVAPQVCEWSLDCLSFLLKDAPYMSARAQLSWRVRGYLSNPLFRWCRRPDCGDGLLRGDDGPLMTCVSCGTVTCFEHEFDHPGLTCDAYNAALAQREHQDRAAFASELAISHMTKDCPHCRVPIEKDGGCRHMTCLCGHEFFWCCLRAYRDPQDAALHRRNCP